MNLPSTAAAAAECGDCHSQKQWVLHHVHDHGRICTSCVLLSHPDRFCPSCFQLHGGATAVPPPSDLVKCIKCHSQSHSQCVPQASRYLCPPCADPSFSFFDLGSNRALDKKLAGELLCAARIASESMNNAVVAAREDAVKWALEASLARKRAREALDDLARLKEASSSGEVVSGPVNANAGIKDKFQLPWRDPNLSSAVGWRHSHSEGFDRFVAAASHPFNNWV